MYRKITPIVTALLLLLLAACESNYYPKPKGFFRIDLPEKEYILFDSLLYPYRFDIPSYALIIADTTSHAEPFWINVEFPTFNASLHFSYKKIQNNIDVYFEDSRLFVNKHIPKANLINERVYSNVHKKVHGVVFNVEGTGVASPVQFFLTDTTNHFVRAALYFNVVPNNDSLKPVIDFIKEDIEHLIESFEWNNSN